LYFVTLLSVNNTQHPCRMRLASCHRWQLYQLWSILLAEYSTSPHVQLRYEKWEGKETREKENLQKKNPKRMIKSMLCPSTKWKNWKRKGKKARKTKIKTNQKNPNIILWKIQFNLCNSICIFIPMQTMKNEKSNKRR